VSRNPVPVSKGNRRASVPIGASADLMGRVVRILESAQHSLVRSVNSQMVVAYWLIGREIVEALQGGGDRAGYGDGLLDELSRHLSERFGRGFSTTNLKNFRLFYQAFSRRVPEIRQTVSDESLLGEGALEGFSAVLSWSHYLFLVGIKRAEERRFYEIEAAKNEWSLSELRRQFDASLFERLALSRKPSDIKELARKGQILEKPRDVLKDPYVLEFLGLEARASYSESELEAAIIDKIEHFLLELGKGFLFEARQKRFTFDDEHFFVDLVFYNRLLRCYVLIDLKIGKLTHQNLGQMQMYVNYFDRHVKRDHEAPTIGIILCRKKNDALVEITLPKAANIHASEYQLYLPSKEELQERLGQWLSEAEHPTEPVAATKKRSR
jgi:predicted nuclease of restriction endonuclease-like (RecB) superfamily